MATSCKKICVAGKLGNLCRERKACACECDARFKGINPSIADSCVAQCWTTPNLHNMYSTPEEYMCSNFDHQELFARHGYLCEGFDPMEDSLQGKVYQEEQRVAAEQSKTSQKLIIVFVLVLVVLLTILLLLPGKKKPAK